jgi:triosephosphate isomerase
VGATLSGSPVTLAAQTVHWDDRGAFTGEVSPSMLAEAGVRWVLVGHSERRHIFGETDEQVGKKVAACLRHGLTPVICVGEKEGERDAGHTSDVVTRQLEAALAAVTAAESEIVVAYEPVWAIGTGRNATPGQAEEVHASVRAVLVRRLGGAAAEAVPILYGGSVTPDNAPGLLRRPEINGALVGGASLDPDRFLAIARATV